MGGWGFSKAATGISMIKSKSPWHVPVKLLNEGTQQAPFGMVDLVNSKRVRVFPAEL